MTMSECALDRGIDITLVDAKDSGLDQSVASYVSASKRILDLLAEGHELVVAFGNSPETLTVWEKEAYRNSFE